MNFKTENSSDIIRLFVALNVFGYNDENNNEGMFPARKKAREALVRFNLTEKYPILRKLLAKHHPWKLLRILLSHPKTNSVTQHLMQQLNIFYNEPGVFDICNNLTLIQSKKTKKFSYQFQKEAVKLFSFVRKNPPNITRFILIFNPMDAYWRGYSFTVQETGYVVVGPGVDKNNYELVRHELLHMIAPAFKIPKELVPDDPSKEMVRLGYDNQSVLRNEYTVNALNLLYEKEVLRQDITKKELQREKQFPGIKKVIKFLEEKLKRDHF